MYCFLPQSCLLINYCSSCLIAYHASSPDLLVALKYASFFLFPLLFLFPFLPLAFPFLFPSFLSRFHRRVLSLLIPLPLVLFIPSVISSSAFFFLFSAVYFRYFVDSFSFAIHLPSLTITASTKLFSSCFYTVEFLATPFSLFLFILKFLYGASVFISNLCHS